MTDSDKSNDLDDDSEFVYCHECGAEIKRDAEICTECGVSQLNNNSSTLNQETNSGQNAVEQTTTNSEEEIVYCHECGAEIKQDAEICNECGVRQKAPSQSIPDQSATDLPSSEQTKNKQTGSKESAPSDAYTIFQWVASIGVAILTFPVGLIVPGYLFYKTKTGAGKNQTGLESWTAILFGIIGIIFVEIGGKTAAKLLWGISVLVLVVGIIIGLNPQLLLGM